MQKNKLKCNNTAKEIILRSINSIRCYKPQRWKKIVKGPVDFIIKGSIHIRP